MINSFADLDLERLHKDGDSENVPPDVAPKVLMILDAMEAADKLQDLLNLPGIKSIPLKEQQEDLYAVAVDENWRLLFLFENGTFCNVSLKQVLIGL